MSLILFKNIKGPKAGSLRTTAQQIRGLSPGSAPDKLCDLDSSLLLVRRHKVG